MFRHRRALLLGVIICLIGACTDGPPRRVLDPTITPIPTIQSASSPTTGPPTTTSQTATITTTTIPPTTMPPTTVAPTTTVRATTAPPSTIPLPMLGPDQQPATADEGRALLSMVPTAELPTELAGLVPAMDEALQRVIDGGRPDEAFFDDVGAFAPAGVAVSPYLICPLTGNRKCAASRADLTRFVSKCGGERTYLFTSIVARADGWAAAGTCVWVPTADEVVFVTQAAANLLLDELDRRGQPFVRDLVLDGYAAAMAESAATQPRLGAAKDLDEFFAGRDAINDYAWNDHHGYGYFSISAVSPAAIAEGGASQSDAREAVDDYHFDGTAYVGVGTCFARGELVTYYAIVT
jgi:hypothetical protein